MRTSTRSCFVALFVVSALASSLRAQTLQVLQDRASDGPIPVRVQDAPEPAPAAAPEPVPTQEQSVSISTTGLLNRHLKKVALQMDMGTVKVFVSGQFSRDQKKGFLVIHSNRFRTPLYFNLEGLLDNVVEIEVAGGKYKLSVDWSVSGKMAFKAKIVPSDGSQGVEPTFSQLFESTFNSGEKAMLAGIEHRLFYLTDVTGALQGQQDPERRTFVLLSRNPKDKDEYFPYVIPAEDLPANGDEREFSFGANPIKKLAARLKDGAIQVRVPK